MTGVNLTSLCFFWSRSPNILISRVFSFGPFKGAQPDGTYWAQNFPHTAWYDLSEYYITAFKTGSYPTITVRLLNFQPKPLSNSLNRRISFTSGLALILPLPPHPVMVLESPLGGIGLRCDIYQKRICEALTPIRIRCGLWSSPPQELLSRSSAAVPRIHSS